MLINDEIDAAISIKAGTIKSMGRIFNRFMDCVNKSITPFSSSPMDRIINIKMVIVAVLENPLIASSGVVRPNKTSDTIIRNAILSMGRISVAKRKIVTPIITNTRMISILTDFLG